MNIISLIIEVISGAVGGNVAGAAMKENSLGTVGNSIAGIVGGGLGGTLLQMVMGSAATGGGSMDLSSILSNVGRRPCLRSRMTSIAYCSSSSSHCRINSGNLRSGVICADQQCRASNLRRDSAGHSLGHYLGVLRCNASNGGA